MTQPNIVFNWIPQSVSARNNVGPSTRVTLNENIMHIENDDGQFIVMHVWIFEAINKCIQERKQKSILIPEDRSAFSQHMQSDEG
jgi:hypothetical protein